MRPDLACLQRFWWQQSLYRTDHARLQVSYNRPFNVPNLSTWLFSAEYPMWRWLEANGYDVSYIAGADTDRNGALIKQHKIFMSVGMTNIGRGDNVPTWKLPVQLVLILHSSAATRSSGKLAGNQVLMGQVRLSNVGLLQGNARQYDN